MNCGKGCIEDIRSMNTPAAVLLWMTLPIGFVVVVQHNRYVRRMQSAVLERTLVAGVVVDMQVEEGMGIGADLVEGIAVGTAVDVETVVVQVQCDATDDLHWRDAASHRQVQVRTVQAASAVAISIGQQHWREIESQARQAASSPVLLRHVKDAVRQKPEVVEGG
jgi:hypothetical protein